MKIQSYDIFTWKYPKDSVDKATLLKSVRQEAFGIDSSKLPDLDPLYFVIEKLISMCLALLIHFFSFSKARDQAQDLIHDTNSLPRSRPSASLPLILIYGR